MIKRIFHSTIAKIIIGFVVIIAAYYLPLVGLNNILRAFKEIQIARLIIVPIISIIFVLLSYIALYRYYEKRKITEFSIRNVGKYFLIGLLLGLLLPSLSILVAYLKGEYIILSVNYLTNIFLRDLTISICFGIATAVFEEVLFRGVFFRLMEEKLGSYIALIISALVFGFVHLLNENSSLLAAVAISVEAGVLLAAAYIYTRNLWFPIAIHFAWNFCVGDFWGTEVSGNAPSTPIIVSKLEGSEWLTGGVFGIEASVQAMIFGLIAGIILLVLSHKKGNIKKQQVFKMKTE